MEASVNGDLLAELMVQVLDGSVISVLLRRGSAEQSEVTYSKVVPDAVVCTLTHRVDVFNPCRCWHSWAGSSLFFLPVPCALEALTVINLLV